MKSFLLLILLTIHVTVFSQWSQRSNFTIDVTLNDLENTLSGHERITYINHSPDTLRFIWFHVWPNAYKNDQTAFSEQLLANNRTDFYFSSRDQRGYINRLDLKVGETTAFIEDHPEHIDIIKVNLPDPLLPGDSVTISTGFHVKLPDNFSRSGHFKQQYLIAQWYPKPAVYDQKGWHPMPYLDQGEFYSDFGNYDVRITVPQNYVVASTGELQNAEELDWLKQRNNFSYQPTAQTVIKKGPGQKAIKVAESVDPFPPSASEMKTIRYLQNNVHDFAWFADKRYIVNYDTISLASGRTISLFSYYLTSKRPVWQNSIAMMKDAVRTRSAWLGEYPYNTVSAVDAELGFAGGMEYPTVTSISTTSSEQDLDETLSHEIGHNWLYGILATNERDYPWMDEGMNTYYDHRYHNDKYDGTATSSKQQRQTFLTRRLPADAQQLLSETLASLHKDQPINTTSSKLTELNYGLMEYDKAGEWMKNLERYLGLQTFDSAMHQYYRRWQFKHPYPDDFKSVLETVSGKNLDLLFAQLDQPGSLLAPVRKTVRFAGVFNLKNTRTTKYLSLSPAIGANLYDGLMIGAILHNYQLPLNPFSFFVMPLFATNSKKLNGLAKLSYSWYPDKGVYRIDAGVNAAVFSKSSYQPDQGETIFTGFKKLVPFVRVTLNEQDPLSKIERYMQLKSYVIREEELQFKQVITGTDTSNQAGRSAGTRNLLQLRLAIENTRVLYPYHASLVLEQQLGFLRLGLTGNYFFNYANGQSGMNVRVFAGKFMYTGGQSTAKQFQTDRYHLNLTAPNGYEDYTYSNYFVGRNKFEGWGSQQLMIRDGGFKVRTDLLSSKVGKTDNWLMATNLTTDIPKTINPLRMLPIKIPLKVFADIGTYAEAWQKDAETTRFLFDAGFQLSLFRETVNIYVPVIYSTVFKDYFRSTLGDKRFLKTISFSIDIQAFSLKKINRNIPFNSMLP